MDNLTKKVQKILIDKYGEGFDDGWFENGTLFKNIIKATEEALTIHSVVVPKGTLLCTSCDGAGGRVIYDTYLKCKECNGSGAK